MCKRVKKSPNPQARRPRAAHGKGSAAREAMSGSEEDEKEGVEWGAAKYGVRMSPAHPWSVGRGDDTNGGEMVYTIKEIQELLSPQQIPLLFVHVPHAGFPLIFASPNRLDPMPQSPQLACGPRPARTSPFFLDILWHVDRNGAYLCSVLVLFVVHIVAYCMPMGVGARRVPSFLVS